MIKKNKFEIGIIVCLLLFSLILYGISLISDVVNSNNSYLLFLKPYTVLSCTKWKCENKSDSLFGYNNKPYYIYLNGKYVGVNDLYYNSDNEKYYVFDKNDDNILKEDDRLFAYDGKARIVQKHFDYFDVSEKEVSKLRDFTMFDFDIENVVKVSMDFDDDGKKENIYTVSSNDEEGNSFFSLVLYEDDNKLNLLNRDVSTDNTNVGYSYVSNVIDVFDDGKLEFIDTRTYFDNIGSCNVIYRLKGKKFVSVNECEIVRSK